MRFRHMLLIVACVCVMQSFKVMAGYSSFVVKNAMMGPYAPEIHVKATSQSCMNSVSPRFVTIQPSDGKATIHLAYESTWYKYCGTHDSTQNFEVSFTDRHGKKYSAAFYYKKKAGGGESLNITKDPEYRLKALYSGSMVLAVCNADDKLCY